MKLDSQGILIQSGGERITNTRYADDILLYAKSLPEFQSMAELLIEELSHVGLQLNASKSKIFRSTYQDGDYNLDFVDVAGEMVEVLQSNQWHRYLGRRLCLSSADRCSIEFKYRK